MFENTEIIGILLGVFITVIPLILWLWAIVHVAKSTFKDGTTKAIWFVVVFFLYIIGAAIYFFAGRPIRGHDKE